MTAFFDAVASVIDYVVSFVLDVVNLAKMVAEFAAKVPEYLTGLVPAPALATIAVIVSVVVLYKILGRD